MPHISTRAAASAIGSKQLVPSQGEAVRLAQWVTFEAPRVKVDYFRREIDEKIIYEDAFISVSEYRGKIGVLFIENKLQALVEDDVNHEVYKISHQMRTDIKECMEAIRTAFEKHRQE